MRLLYLFIVGLFATEVFSQSSVFAWPLDSPCIITGNYGELRPNHFHAGIDFSTGGKMNKRVYAVMDGYVSRIRVNASGYGKCIYITHPNGLVTVYAHLNSLSLKIADAVKADQVSRRSFEVELLPAPGLFKVKQGEVIGLSGNSGGSTGPHLHFEVRDEKSETPFNPFDYFKIRDNISPVLEAIAIYDLSDTLKPVLMRTTRMHGAAAVPRFVTEKNVVGFAFMGFDRNIPKGNKGNVHKTSLFMDGKLIYSHVLNRIDFSDGRYVNEFCEAKGRLRLQRCFMPTLYPSRFYVNTENKGVVVLNDTLSHQFRIVISDELGNETKRNFSVKNRGAGGFKTAPLQSPGFVKCDADFFWQGESTKLFIPSASLYRSVDLQIYDQMATASKFVIHPSLNLRSAIVIVCKVPAKYTEVSDKLVLRSNSGPVVGVSRRDSIYFYCKGTGTFVLQPDLEPPSIRTYLSAKRISRLRHPGSFAFHVSDKLSGLANYSVTVNGQWVLAEFDAKSNALIYTFDNDTPLGPLEFEVEAEDRVGNRRKFSYRLRR